jgi:beta-N-acetylhexosaminidase
MHYGPVMIDLKGLSLSEAERALIQHPMVGGVLFFTRNYHDITQLKSLVAEIRHTAHQKPLLLAVDHEGGRVWRFRKDFHVLGPAKDYGLIYAQDPQAGLKCAEEAGTLMAAELLASGIDLSLAPVLDVDSGISEVIGDRAFDHDPARVGELAGAFIAGMAAAGMAATGKHFPGHGGCQLDSHIAQPIDTRSFEQIWDHDLVPFRQLSPVLKAVMPAHVIYPSVDAMPAGFSSQWLQTILREKIGFEGAIISDCLSMTGAAAAGGDLLSRAHKALGAGCDRVIVCQQSIEDLTHFLENLNRETSAHSHRRLANMAARN